MDLMTMFWNPLRVPSKPAKSEHLTSDPHGNIQYYSKVKFANPCTSTPRSEQMQLQGRKGVLRKHPSHRGYCHESRG